MSKTTNIPTNVQLSSEDDTESSQKPTPIQTLLAGGDWLKSLPSGAYTTARTTNQGTSIFEWSTHLTRTIQSAKQMGCIIPSSDTEPLSRSITCVVKKALELYRSTNSDYESELKITLLLTWSSSPTQKSTEPSKTTIRAHVAKLPTIPTPPIRVEVRGEPRTNALAKSSSWVTSRAPYEALLSSSPLTLNEFLLVTSEGGIMEGSQTNFVAVIDGVLWTAGDGVLEGTVRRLTLEVCEKHGIPVTLKPPSLSDIKDWEGCFISSTSRLLLPVDEIYVPQPTEPSKEGDKVMEWNYKDDGIVRKLERLVKEEIRAHSTEMGIPTLTESLEK